MKEKLLTIGKVAKSCNISTNRIKRMEADGLLEPAYIDPNSGYRYYNSYNVARIVTILSLQSFGFNHQEIREHLTHPADYTWLYELVLDKRNTLDRLLNGLRRKIPDSLFGYEIRKTRTYPVYKKSACFKGSFTDFYQLINQAIYEVFDQGLKINPNLPAIIRTNCRDTQEYDYRKEDIYTAMIPLLEHSENAGCTNLGASLSLIIKWDQTERKIDDLRMITAAILRDNLLSQSERVFISFDLSQHMDPEIVPEDQVFYFYIPVEKKTTG